MNQPKRDPHYSATIKALDNQQLLVMLWEISAELSSRTKQAMIITLYQGDCEIQSSRRIGWRSYEKLKAAIANLIDLGKS
jgi:hypothetical protein